MLRSGVGTATRVLRLKEDLKATLQSAECLRAVRKREGLMGNMTKPATHLVDEAIKLMGRGASLEWI